MFRPAPKPDRHAMTFVFITVLLSMIGMGVVIPVMPALLNELTGATEARAAVLNGYLLTVYAIMQFFMSPILGALSDRFGRRPVLLTSLFAYGIDFALMAIAPTYAWLFLGRMLAGAFAATYAVSSAFIADVSPPEKRAANFGLIGAAFGLGFIIGPAIGGRLGDIDPRLPFMLASGIAFANFTFGYFVFPETLAKEKRRKFDWRRANPLGGLISVGKHPIVLGVLGAFFLMQLSHNALPGIWAFFTKEKFAWSETDIGNSLAFVGVTAALVQGVLTRRIIPIVGETNAVLIGMCAMVASFLGYAFFTPSGGFVYLWISVGALGGFIMPGMQTIMSRATPEDAQGELQGAIASLMSITLGTSPLLMTHVFQQFTRDGAPVYFPGAPWVVSASVLALALIPFWLTMRKVPATPKPAPAPV